MAARGDVGVILTNAAEESTRTGKALLMQPAALGVLRVSALSATSCKTQQKVKS
jgi:hypothetical protein